MARHEWLKRYTTLAAAIDLLVEHRLALLDPSTWQDRNDVRFLKQYSSTLGLKSLCAACFTQRTETYHHWQVFAGEGEGVCIELNKRKLLQSLEVDQSYHWGNVKYLRIEQLNAMKWVDAYELPYMKRSGFGDEQEFRLIWRSETEDVRIHHVPIELSWIGRIVLNPWLPEALFRSIKTALQAIPGCSEIKVVRTTLIDNAAWKRACERVDEIASLVGPPERRIG